MLHCCFHPRNNTRFFLKWLCRWLSDLLGHLLATISSVQVAELHEQERRALLKAFIEHFWKHSSYCSLNTCFVLCKLLSKDRLSHALLPAAPANVEPLFLHGSWWPGSGAGWQPDNMVISVSTCEAWKSPLSREWPFARKWDLEPLCGVSGTSLHLLPDYPGWEGER